MWVVFIFSGAALMGIFSFFCCYRNKPHIHDDHSKTGAPPDSKPVTTKNAGKPEPYSEGCARQLFKTYEDPDTPGEIGPEGFEKLCTDLDISLEGALPLVLAWQVHATEMARFKEAEWLKGTGELRYVFFLPVEMILALLEKSCRLWARAHRVPMRSASNLQALSLVLRNIEDLLLLDKPPIAPSGTGSVRKRGPAVPATDASEPYNRQRYYQYAADTKKAYAELYTFCFALAKPSYVIRSILCWIPVLTRAREHRTARNIDMDVSGCSSSQAVVFVSWTALLIHLASPRLQVPSGLFWSRPNIPS